MVLGADVLAVGAKSYRQPDMALPSPTVVVEVPSDTRGWSRFWAKAHRYRRLGVVLYVINLDHPAEDSVMRFGPDDDGVVHWTGRPIPELGDLIVDLVDKTLVGQGRRIQH